MATLAVTPATLAAANTVAVAGDTLSLHGGTYTTSINPTHSGTRAARITYEPYGDGVPLFTVGEAGGRWAIKLQGASYIRVLGIVSFHCGAFYRIGYGSSHNEIAYCDFSEDTRAEYSTALIAWTSSAGAEGAGSDHNWVHHNTFSRYGWIQYGVDSQGKPYLDDKGTIRISANGNDPSCHNTFEDNVFFYGGHDLLDIGGPYNVARNNTFHNEEVWFRDEWRIGPNVPASGYFGNRCILLSNSGNYPGTANHTLIEGNRIGYAGTPPDDDGSSGIENAGAHTVVRFNDIYGHGGMGYYSKMQPGGAYPSPLDSGSHARVYRNTITKCGRGDPSLSFRTAVTVWSYSNIDDWPRDVVIRDNIVCDNNAEFETGTPNILPQITYENNFTADPMFADADFSDKTSLTRPDLSLRAGSPCIGAGKPLARTTGAGANTRTLAVSDALPFFDGTQGSDLTWGLTQFPDWIAIGDASNAVEISAVDYETGVITLASPRSWADDAPVWLYCKSDGARVLYGSAPDIGAHEYDEGDNNMAITRTVNFTLEVLAPEDIFLTLTPLALAVRQGGVAVYNITVQALNDFAGPVTFTLEGLPVGATHSFSVNPVATSGASVLTIDTATLSVGGPLALVLRATA